MRSFGFVALVAIGLASAARGQVLYQTAFDDDGGWSFDPPNEDDSQWKVDAEPSFTSFGAFHSPPSSLNYNNDLDYSGFALHFTNGTNAESPNIDLSIAAGTPTLFFWCNNKMQEHMCDNHESITVRVFASGVLELTRCLTCSSCYQNQGAISPCSYGDWHQHAIALDKTWGVINVVFRFRGDSIANETEGYFVDDLSIVDVLPTTTYCTAKLNSQGCAATIAASGTPNVAGTGSFVLSCAQVLNQKNGLFFYGINGRHSGAFLGGTLCVKQPVRRTTIVSSGGNATPPDDCSGVLSLDFNAWIAAGHDPALTAGVDVDGQYWYRDPADPFRTGLSNGVEFTIVP
jgi:hypothetical protein